MIFKTLLWLRSNNFFLQKHGHIIVNHCLYCNIVYGEATKFSYHLEHDHGLPTIFTPRETDDIERMTGYQQVEKAFWDHWNHINSSEGSHQLIYSNYFVLKKNQIQNLIREKCRNGLKKFQLTTELKLVKPKVDDDSQETITIYTNTTLQPVYFYGITDNDYYQLIEQLTSALFIFALQGSGWIFPKLKTFLLNIHPILLFGVALTWHFQINFKVVGHYSIFGTLKMRIDVYIVIRPLTTCTQSYPWL